MPKPDPGEPPTVRARGLSKAYRVPGAVRRQAAKLQGRTIPPEVPALDGLDFDVAPGEVYGVLGPNGAGKTTLMKVLATVLVPDAGTVEVLGKDIVRDAAALRPRIGFALGEYERTFHWRLTGRQNLRFFADFYAIPKAEAQSRIRAVLEAVDLADAAETRFNAYSTGMKHRLALARALLPDPDILLLDEPTAGLDPASSGQIAEVVRARATSGTTVLYTTHRLHEAGVLCDRILVLDQGKAAADATPEALARLAKGSQVVEVHRRGGGAWERTFVEPIAALTGVVDWETRGERLLFYTENDDNVVASVVQAVRERGAGTLSITVRPPDVEDAFTSLIERQRRHKEVPA